MLFVVDFSPKFVAAPLLFRAGKKQWPKAAESNLRAGSDNFDLTVRVSSTGELMKESGENRRGFLGRRISPTFRGSPVANPAWFPLAFLFLFFTSSPSPAETNSALPKTVPAVLDFPTVPKEYGEVIYRSRGESAKQLYIIGLEHRDSITRANGAHTSKVQAEVYKIGEWLIVNRDIDLLLPEGFFGKPGKGVRNRPAAGKTTGVPKIMDVRDLEERLADNTAYVNAEMLLKGHFGLSTRQIEDNRMYDVASERLRKLVGAGDSSSFLLLKSEMDYLQEKRVAAMLQNIPGVVGEEYRESHIRNKRALFTIGISHISKIIRYLERNRIEIHGPVLNSAKCEDYSADLILGQEQFGVTVIVPKRLADNDRLMKLTDLDKIVDQCRKNPSLLSSQVLP